MKRRDVLKGAVVAAGVAVVGLPKVVEAKPVQWGKLSPRWHYDGTSVVKTMGVSYRNGRMVVELHVYGDAAGKFAARWQALFEEWESIYGDFRPIEKVIWDPAGLQGFAIGCPPEGSPW